MPTTTKAPENFPITDWVHHGKPITQDVPVGDPRIAKYSRIRMLSDGRVLDVSYIVVELTDGSLAHVVGTAGQYGKARWISELAAELGTTFRAVQTAAAVLR